MQVLKKNSSVYHLARMQMHASICYSIDFFFMYSSSNWNLRSKQANDHACVKHPDTIYICHISIGPYPWYHAYTCYNICVTVFFFRSAKRWLPLKRATATVHLAIYLYLQVVDRSSISTRVNSELISEQFWRWTYAAYIHS